MSNGVIVVVIGALVVMAAGCGSYGYATKSVPGIITQTGTGLDGMPVDSSKPISFKILSPREGEVVAGPDLSVAFQLDNYLLEEKGNHVHFILDNQPYVPWYKAGEPCVFKNVPRGPHVIRAFPSRPWHESWKNPEAFSMVRFYVKDHDPSVVGKRIEEDIQDEALDAMIKPQWPILTFSRPKGEYAGDQTKKILLDFWLKNANLSADGYKVRYVLDGQPFVVTTWEPVWFEHLTPGVHTLVLELLDKDGAVVVNGWNRTERTFTVKTDSVSPQTHQH